MSKNHNLLQWKSYLGQEVLLYGQDGRYYAGLLHDDPARQQFLLQTDIDKAVNIVGMGIKYLGVAEIMLVSQLKTSSYEYQRYLSLIKPNEKGENK